MLIEEEECLKEELNSSSNFLYLNLIERKIKTKRKGISFD